MTEAEIEARVFEVVADQLGADLGTLTLETRFVEDLGADSLDLIELLLALEEEFCAASDEEDASAVATVEHAVICVLRMLEPEDSAGSETDPIPAMDSLEASGSIPVNLLRATR